MFVYVVKPDDTLAGVATHFGVDVDQLRNLNSLVLTDLTQGQALLIPSNRYLVQPGDTLWKLQEKTGLPWQSIARANRLTPRSQLRVGQVLRLVPPSRPEIEVTGYLPVTDPGTTARDLAPWADVLTYVGIFAYILGADGSVKPIDDAAAIAQTRQIAASPLLSIANIQPGGAFSTDVARAILSDPETRSHVVDRVMALMQSKGYDGIDADIEALKPDLQDEYVAFLRELKERLGSRLLTVAAPPKWNEKVFAYAAGHDYAGIGRVADRVFIMNYEFHWIGGPPGPIAPLPETRRVLQYASRLIPKDRVIGGILTTAYDWTLPDTPENMAKAMTHGEAITLAQRLQVPIRYNETAETPWFRYTDATGVQHEVWFEDARSLMVKLMMIRDLGLRGVGIWQLDAFSPHFPPLLRHLFTVQKG